MSARLTALACAALFGLAMLAAWLVPPLLDWDRYRDTVATVASAGLGRPVRIAGPIRLSLLPQAVLYAGAVSLADTGDGATVDVGEMRLRVALGPLLAGRVEPQELVLHRPDMHLPWPLAPFTPRGAPAGLHARVEQGTLTIGAFPVTAIDGELAVDPVTGILSAAGLGTALGRSWRMTGRLGRAGMDGSATIELSLDGQGQMVGTGAALSGQIGAEGGLAGRVTGRGPELSLLLTAPALPWRAEGRLAAGSGLVVADDLELELGGVPARGAVALRLLPQLRLDAALATSRIDLDAWLPALLHGGAAALPTGIDLSTEAASLSGGTLRRVRAGFELAGDGVVVREADAVLPGDAALHLTGQISGRRFTGEARLAAPDAAQTLAWLRPHAPALMDTLPAGAVHGITVSAAIRAGSDTLSLDSIHGDIDGAALAGNLALHGGERPAVAASLELTGLALDRFLPNPPASLAEFAARIKAWPGGLATLDGDVTLVATNPLWRGALLDRLELSARLAGGVLELRRASLTGPALSASLSGWVAPGGQVSDARVAFAVEQAERLTPLLPASWTFARPLFRGPAALAGTVSGQPSALNLAGALDLSDARLQVDGRADLPGRRWQGGVSLHHPGAPRLLWALGAGDVASWLGDGSLSVQARVDASADAVALSGLEVSAGQMRAGGELRLSGLGQGNPVVTGRVDADTLPIPQLRPHADGPWPVGLLQAGDATVAVHAAHVLAGLSPLLEDASATVSVTGGALVVDRLTARLGGGSLTGRVSVQDAAPPRLTASGRLTGAVLDGQLGGAPLDLVGGRADLEANVSGAGYSPAGMLATLNGPVRVTVRDGALAGLDAGRVLAALHAAVPDVAAALSGGQTPFTRLDLAGTVANGTLTLGQGAIATDAGAIGVTGSVDLPREAIDLRLALRPAADGAPILGLRLIGPWAAPSRTPELADLARWLAVR